MELCSTVFLMVSKPSTRSYNTNLKRGETLPIHINMSFPSMPCEDGASDEKQTQLSSKVFISPFHFCLEDDKLEPRWCEDGKAMARGDLQAMAKRLPDPVLY